MVMSIILRRRDENGNGKTRREPGRTCSWHQQNRPRLRICHYTWLVVALPLHQQPRHHQNPTTTITRISAYLPSLITHIRHHNSTLPKIHCDAINQSNNQNRHHAHHLSVLLWSLASCKPSNTAQVLNATPLSAPVRHAVLVAL